MRARPCGSFAIVSHIECSHGCRRTERRPCGDLTPLNQPAPAQALPGPVGGRGTSLSGPNGCRETTVGGEMVGQATTSVGK